MLVRPLAPTMTWSCTVTFMCRPASTRSRVRRMSCCDGDGSPLGWLWTMMIAVAPGATAIIIVHNHPSGDPSPSQQDIRLTRDLVEAGRHMKVTVHDHVIVGASGRTSMRSMGLI